jgi:hypothetical protein
MRVRLHSSISLLPAFAVILTGCTGTGSDPIQPANGTFTVGGTVSGLSGGQIVLEDNARDNLTVSSNGSFTFSAPLTAGSFFFVSVLSQPASPAQSCIVNDPGGSVTTANATSVQIVCSAVPALPASITTAANQWTWAGGDDVPDQAGVYGQLGVPAVGNAPGARAGAVGWTDESGNFWLFGGAGPTVGGWCALHSALCAAGTQLYFNDLWKFDGSEWSWMGGLSSFNQSGVYGTLSQAAAGNAPGSRYGEVSWTDGQGNFWLFGGTGYDSAGNVGALNDLWRYANGQWTWVGGSKVINQPGVYGIQGTPSAGNIPGARSGAIAFADAFGNAWLFSGQGCDSTSNCGGALNDLWEFSGGQWTWVRGDNVSYPAQPGIYGTLGTPSPSNLPGARYNTTGWMDYSGDLWIFGGAGYDLLDLNVGELNDLMRFSSGEWTWMGGSDNLFDQIGTYGTEGTPAPGNVPGSRDSSAGWTDANGNLWLFSGEGFGATYAGTEFNDLWEYSAGEWTWVGGFSTGIQYGTYGTLGVPAPGNIPGARIGAVTWTDSKGNLWLFGGTGEAIAGSAGDLNDLWVYQPE